MVAVTLEDRLDSVCFGPLLLPPPPPLAWSTTRGGSKEGGSARLPKRGPPPDGVVGGEKIRLRDRRRTEREEEQLLREIDMPVLLLKSSAMRSAMGDPQTPRFRPLLALDNVLGDPAAVAAAKKSLADTSAAERDRRLFEWEGDEAEESDRTAKLAPPGRGGIGGGALDATLGEEREDGMAPWMEARRALIFFRSLLTSNSS